ncbi:MAG: hypothetical protein QXZ68_03815 [Candidatus Bathyarchaeia archaeon]
MKIKPLTVILLATLCLCTAFVHKNVRTCAASGGASLKLVDVMVDYGNGTCRWASCILRPGNDTVYNATQQVAISLNVSWSSYGAFVDAIDGVWNNYTSNTSWMWWYWNHSAGCWEIGSVAWYHYVLEDCDIVAWYYEDCGEWPPDPPQNPPAIRVIVLLDYGNNTRVWYTDVEVLGYASVLKATKAIAPVEYLLYGADVWVEAINNIPNNSTAKRFWMWWIWNFTAGEWGWGPVACNKYCLSDGDVVAWYYETEPWGPPEVEEIIPEMGMLTVYLVSATGVVAAFPMFRGKRTRR